MNSGKIVAGGWTDGWKSKVLQEVLADLKSILSSWKVEIVAHIVCMGARGMD